ncbi:TenA family transcriptional regulator [Rhodococcus spongiicola]|uniref:TenA family transcriptional regulator n=2 Tax=Rhodococcus spongiicola TaxID=2487352 RepID=A0A3S3E686_9NOCA|nr:TenA family protein [Rhodococcus spongiicola]RVW06712.1 TenA family transcriptional regulator [Rhodococcus spongiicola]
MTTPVQDSSDHSATEGARFTDLLWERTADLRALIDDMEFLRRLGDGTLPLDVFRHYIEQDSLYLAEYTKALALLATKSPDPQTAAFWATSAATAAVVETQLHGELLAGGSLPESTQAPEHSPACLGYVSYLTATASTEPYPVGAAAVLPCFWIYAVVGRRLAATAHEVLAADPSHPYAQWVTTYDDPAFQESVESARRLVDAAADAATAEQREAMIRAFVIATRYEFMFWDTSLNQQSWPAS